MRVTRYYLKFESSYLFPKLFYLVRGIITRSLSKNTLSKWDNTLLKQIPIEDLCLNVVLSYKSLEIWILAIEQVIAIHEMALGLPKFEMYEEGSQIRK